jgi:hypothetical protein
MSTMNEERSDVENNKLKEENEEINWKKCACWLKNWRQILIKFIFFLFCAWLEAASYGLRVFSATSVVLFSLLRNSIRETKSA